MWLSKVASRALAGLHGQESSGKTTLAPEVQQTSVMADFNDADHALDPAYVKSLGVNVEAPLVSQPDSGEMTLDIVDQLVIVRSFILVPFTRQMEAKGGTTEGHRDICHTH